ncbi:MAG TPA: MMPL family transporter [Thermomicrobiales bacterium]|nr:MMPL family transporter [Thermomicrobiales bacterium]
MASGGRDEGDEGGEGGATREVGPVARGFARVVTGPLRFVIVLAWLAAAVAAYRYLPDLQQVEQSGPSGILAPQNAAALRVEERAVQIFGFPLISRTLVVQRDPGGLAPAARRDAVVAAARVDAREVPDLTGIAGALPIFDLPALVPFAREHGTTAITYLYFSPQVGLYARDQLAGRYARDELGQPGDALVGVTGLEPARIAQVDRITGALSHVELATAILIAVVVGLNFRAPGAPALTLVTAGIAYVLATRLAAYGGARLGLTVPAELEPLLVVLVLAVCTDYAVFFLSGTRRRLAGGAARADAARDTAAEFAPIIFTAGLAVAAGTACLLAARLAFLRSIGPALAIAVAVTLAVSLTFVPAALAIAARPLFWPSLHRGGAKRGGASWRARLEGLTTRPRTAAFLAVLCVALLAGAATGLGRLALGLTVLGGLPGDAGPARAARAAGLGFAPGIISPTVLLVEQPGITGHRDELVRLEDLLARQPGVAGVIGPREQPGAPAFGVVLARDGSAARYVIVLADDPYSARALTTLGALQRRLPALLAAAGLPGARPGLAGDTALARETIDRIEGSFVPVAVAIALVDLCLMALLLRALVAPLYLLAASALSVATPLGLTVYLFQLGLGRPDLSYYVPIGAGVLLIALGSDYNLFVVGRIWEEARARPLREAISRAAPRATRAISIAAVTLAASFALLALVPLAAFREFASAMAVGVLLDSFVVRTYLVPALITLVGKRSFWPGRRRWRPSPPHPPSPNPGRRG